MSVGWSVVDADSTVAVQIGCDTKSVTTDTTGQTFTCQATGGGGTASKSVTIKRDATAPVLSPSVSPNPVAIGGTATASPGAIDATSGLASATCAPVATGSAGSFTVACTATDKAGNTASAPVAYVVTTPQAAGSIRFLAPLPGATYDAGGSFRARFRIIDASGKRIPDAAAQQLVAACRVKVGLDRATRCARYVVDKHFFRAKVIVPRRTPSGPHQVVAQLVDAGGTVSESAQQEFTVR